VFSALGSVGGAVALLALPAGAFRLVVPVLILASCVLVVFQPRLSARIAARRERRASANGGSREGKGTVSAGGPLLVEERDLSRPMTQHALGRAEVAAVGAGAGDAGGEQRPAGAHRPFPSRLPPFALARRSRRAAIRALSRGWEYDQDAGGQDQHRHDEPERTGRQRQQRHCPADRAERREHAEPDQPSALAGQLAAGSSRRR